VHAVHFPELPLPLTAKAASVTRSLLPLRYLDVAVIVVAAIPALALGAPVFGYVVGAGAWIIQRVAQSVDRRLLEGRYDDPVRLTLMTLGESFGRTWLLVAAIIVAAVVGNHSDGLTCALVIFAAFTVSFIFRLFNGAAEAAARHAGTPAGAAQPRS
jgi:MFS family permease